MKLRTFFALATAVAVAACSRTVTAPDGGDMSVPHPDRVPAVPRISASADPGDNVVPGPVY